MTGPHRHKWIIEYPYPVTYKPSRAPAGTHRTCSCCGEMQRMSSGAWRTLRVRVTV